MTDARLERIYNVAEMRRRARRWLPKMIFEFVDGGAEDERTVRWNEDGFTQIRLVPRSLEGAARPDLSTEIFGQKLAMPLMIGPTGMAGMIWPQGEIEAAKAAHAAGTAWCMSHGTTCSIEEVVAATKGPLWLQTYIYQDRGWTEHFAARAKAAGYRALVLTIDNQWLGQRERDIRNGFVVPPQPKLSNVIDVFRSLPWLARHGFSLDRIRFANYAELAKDTGLLRLGARMGGMLDPAMSWKDVAWLRRLWDGPLVLKGVLHPDEASRAIDHGIDGIIVSNHGGRQLDGAPAAIEALPWIADVAKGRTRIMLDGGLRRGGDVVRALALGADLCLIGRPQLWGLAVAGQAGVARILEIFRAEMDRVMGLCGFATIGAIDRTALALPSGWPKLCEVRGVQPAAAPGLAAE